MKLGEVKLNVENSVYFVYISSRIYGNNLVYIISPGGRKHFQGLGEFVGERIVGLDAEYDRIETSRSKP